jgi:hypothetical protein
MKENEDCGARSNLHTRAANRRAAEALYMQEEKNLQKTIRGPRPGTEERVKDLNENKVVKSWNGKSNIPLLDWHLREAHNGVSK